MVSTRLPLGSQRDKSTEGAGGTLLPPSPAFLAPGDPLDAQPKATMPHNPQRSARMADSVDETPLKSKENRRFSVSGNLTIHLVSRSLIFMRKKISTTVYITPEQNEQLKLLHDKTKVPVAEYIRQGIDLVLDKYKNHLPGQLTFDVARPAQK